MMENEKLRMKNEKLALLTNLIWLTILLQLNLHRRQFCIFNFSFLINTKTPSSLPDNPASLP